MPISLPYVAEPTRYDTMQYRRCGRSGLLLPALSLGLWHNFGHDRGVHTQQAICRRAFDLGITHFDLANNYGPPYGAAEENFGRILATDFRACATNWSSPPRPATTCGRARTATSDRASTCIASLDQSLARMGLDYVDIFYSHRVDPDTPIEETVGALASRRCSRARRSTWASRRTSPSAPARPPACWPS
jgi:L-glyceraldehyde 3-phosphate reductase